MLKTYQKYIIRNFLSKFFIVTLVFFSFIVILGSFEEITFFKNLKVNFLYPYLLTLLNAPITLFEIFPFIFLLTTQFLFYELFKKDELSLLKMNGLKNTSILKIILILAICIGVINVVIFYNIASNLKFHYLDIKNKYSNDNKYLAMVTKSGLWIKDEINDKKYIIKSKIIEGDFLNENIINEFDQNFNLIRTIQSDKINIKDYEWKILNPIITENNIRITVNDDIILQSNFNSQKISKLFSIFLDF
jgi:lipopolysaccharide export system permease protein